MALRTDYSDAVQLQGRQAIWRRIHWQLCAWAVSAYGDFALEHAVGKDIVSAQFNFAQDDLDYIADHYIHLDHEQAFSASGGVSYVLDGTRLSVDTFYGTGLRQDGAVPNGFCGPPCGRRSAALTVPEETLSVWLRGGNSGGLYLCTQTREEPAPGGRAECACVGEAEGRRQTVKRGEGAERVVADVKQIFDLAKYCELGAYFEGGVEIHGREPRQLGFLIRFIADKILPTLPAQIGSSTQLRSEIIMG